MIHHCAHQCDQELLTQLNILSRVMPHDAISTSSACKPPIKIQKPGMHRSVERFLGGENRRSNMQYLQQLLIQVIDRHDVCARDKNTMMRERLVTETRGAIRGLNNLKQSYEGDAQFQASVDVSIETVKLRLGIRDEDPRKDAPAAEALGGGGGCCQGSAGAGTTRDVEPVVEERKALLEMESEDPQDDSAWS